MSGILKQFLANRSFRTGSIIFCFILLVMTIAPFIVKMEPNTIQYEKILLKPFGENIFGTDDLGRDLFSRVIVGGRVSLMIGLQVMIGTTIFGTIIALLAGYFEKVDIIVMRFMDILMAIPSLLLAISLLAVLRNNPIMVSLALTIVYTPRTVRIVRSCVLALKEEIYVEAARSIGVKTSQILIRHILPGVIPVLIVQETFLFACAILAEAGISFVGLGVQPPDPSWGNILSDARVLMREAPWMVFTPGISIMLTVLSLNLIGDGLREVLDPKRLKGGIRVVRE
jgi:peptide/nickel transport system permease protein